MMVFPSMLESAAKEAGMKVPKDTDNFDEKEFPHFNVFCHLQLCRPIRWGEHWDNAKVIAKLTVDQIENYTLEDYIRAGLEYQT